MSGIAVRARSALGLRGRILGVMLFTTVATLAVAAIALLSPIENSLRKAEQKTLRQSLGAAPARPFRELRFERVYSRHSAQARALGRVETRLVNRIGGTVTVLGYPGLRGHGADVLPATGVPGAEQEASHDRFADVPAAFRSGKANHSIGSLGGAEYARAAIPFTNRNGRRYVLAVRKSIGEIPDVIVAVRRAFFDAALAGLALTLILGIPLSGRLVRRLRRLREAAIQVEHDSPEALVPVDSSVDEVGDLARSLAAMQQRLRGQERARRSFVATASHELRTPLTSLDGMLELLGEDLHDPEPDLDDARDLLERARGQSRRLGRLAADLLDLSRIDAQVELRSEAVELSELSRAVLAEFELGNAERGIHSALDDRSGAVWALGDPGSIARILRILIDNAQRVSPPGSAIRVELGNTGTTCIRVSDDGPGVPEDSRDAIFERFNRGRETAGKSGFGLGLAIGRELARRMGGELALEPAGPGGATFTLQLPAARQRRPEPVPVG